MDEKKFPWLLRLLTLNSSITPMLETYAIDKERVLACIVNDFSSKITQINGRNLPFNTISKCLEYIFSQQVHSHINSIKHTFFRYKGRLSEISLSLLVSYKTQKKSIPSVSYIQSSRVPYDKFVTWVVSVTNGVAKGSIFPSTSNSLIIDRASEMSKEIIFAIESMEHRKVSKISLEFMVDKSFNLYLSFMSSCFLLNKKPRIFALKSQDSAGYYTMNYSATEANFTVKRENSIDIKPISKKGVVANKTCEEVEISEESNASDTESSSSLKNSDSEDEDEKEGLNKHDNFMELICSTRIMRRSDRKKYFISDEELEREQNQVNEIIEEAKRMKNREKDVWHRNSIKHRTYNSKASFAGFLMNSEILRTPYSRNAVSLTDYSLPQLQPHKRSTII